MSGKARLKKLTCYIPPDLYARIEAQADARNLTIPQRILEAVRRDLRLERRNEPWPVNITRKTSSN